MLVSLWRGLLLVCYLEVKEAPALYIAMDFPINIDTIYTGLFIMYFKGSHVDFFQNIDVFLPTKIVLTLTFKAI